jgi:hypothetical protein
MSKTNLKKKTLKSLTYIDILPQGYEFETEDQSYSL